jgi:cell division protein FtsX
MVTLAAACDSGTATTGRAREVPQVRGEDAEVFLDLRATDAQIERVRRVVEHSGVVERFAYVDREAALREFRRIYRNEPDLIASTHADDLPTSFRVTFREPGGFRTLRRSLRGVAGYDEALDRSHPGRETAKALAALCGPLERAGTVFVDAEIFMDVDATPQQEAAVRAVLERAPEVRKFAYLDQQDAYRVFQRIFRDRPKLLADASPETLPTSFRVWFRSGADPDPLLSKLRTDVGLGVDEVKTADPVLSNACRGA